MDRTAYKREGELRTDRVTVRRRPQRGFYDHGTVAAILDETFLCHVGFVADGQPYVIPTSFGRDGKRLYIHGSAASRTLRHLSQALPVCVTVTLLDGLVLARSAFNHSMNYRSVVILGQASLVEGEEKLRALEIMSDHIIPGRWADVRGPTETEMRATSVLKVDITEASAKVRSGPPLDDEEDLAWPCWAGVLPFGVESRPPVPDPKLAAGVPAPDYATRYARLQRTDSNG